MGCLCEEKAGDGLELSPICIGGLWLFRDLDPEEKRALAEKAGRIKLEAGEYIFRQGDPSERMFLIKAGRIKLTKVTEKGDEITLDLRKAGDFLGEYMFEEEGLFPVSAVCLETTLICGFSREEFEALVLAHPGVGLKVIKSLSARIGRLTSRVGGMSHSHLEERLHSVLINVAREHGRPVESGFALHMPLTHEDLAFLVGAHRVSITRAMKALRNLGLVIQEGRTLIVRPAEVG